MASYPTRSLSMRGGTSSASSQAQSTALMTRIQEKRAELDNLKQLRDLSAELASKMEGLENHLATLSDGTEAISAVMSNWHNVLRAINMATSKLSKSADDASGESTEMLPQTLVRIPTEHAPALQAQAEAAAASTQDEKEEP